MLFCNLTSKPSCMSLIVNVMFTKYFPSTLRSGTLGFSSFLQLWALSKHWQKQHELVLIVCSLVRGKKEKKNNLSPLGRPPRVTHTWDYKRNSSQIKRQRRANLYRCRRLWTLLSLFCHNMETKTQLIRSVFICHVTSCLLQTSDMLRSYRLIASVAFSTLKWNCSS